MRTSKVRRSGLWSILVLSLAVVSACGASVQTNQAGASSAAVSDACSISKKATAVPAWTGPNDPVDAAAAKGKTLWFVTISTADPSIMQVYEGIKEAARKVGMSTKIVDANGDIGKVAAGVDQAVAQEANAVAIYSVSAEAVAAQVKNAHDKGIAVFDMVSGNPDASTSVAQAHVTVSYSELGRLRAAEAVCATSGKLNALFVDSKEIPTDPILFGGMKSELNRSCPECPVKTVSASPFKWPQELPPAINNALRSTPGINFVLPNYGGAALYAVPAMQGNGALTRGVKLNAMNGNDANLKLVRDGVITSDVAWPTYWAGWAAVDQTIRLMAHQKPFSGGLPIRMFTKDNLQNMDVKNPDALFEFDYRSQYEKIWGIK